MIIMANEWKGWIIDESLNDTTILSKFKVLKVQTEENGEGDFKRIWKLYTVEVNDEDIEKVSRILEKQIKSEYYIHFTNLKKLAIIFHNKHFIIDLEEAGEDKGYGITSFVAKPKDKALWKSAFEYGIKEGKVDTRYIVTVK